MLVVDEEVGHPVNIEALETTVLVAPTEANVKVGNVLHLLAEHVGDGAVFGGTITITSAPARFSALGREPATSPQATGFNEGSRFGRKQTPLAVS